MQYVRSRIYGTTPRDLKNLNDNIESLWFKVFGNLTFTDFEEKDKKRITSMEYKIGDSLARIAVAENEISLRVTNNDFQSYILQTDKKIEQTVIDITAGYMTQITQLSNSIDLKANKVALDALTGRVTSAEASLTVQAGQISSKVSETDYTGTKIASLINQTSKSINASALNIDLTGFVTFTSLSTPGSTTIHGSNLTAGTVVASRIEAESAVIQSNQGVEIKRISPNGATNNMDIKFRVYNPSGTVIESANFSYVGGMFTIDRSLYTDNFIYCNKLFVGGTEITASGVVAVFG